MSGAPERHSRTPDDPRVEMVVVARNRALGALSVRRVLPYARRRSVGPFVFVDHFGPQVIPAGAPADVRPHPHIGLATVTYLFEGEMVHRDSLGVVQAIVPGDLNLMTAGRGIVHSERLPPALRHRDHRSHGVQTWLALPAPHEDDPPAFAHHPREAFPTFFVDGGEAKLLIGQAWGHRSPVVFPAETLYAEVELVERGQLPLPQSPERGVYVIDGVLRCGEVEATTGELMIFAPGAEVVLDAVTSAHLLVLGGAPVDGPRYMWWNFVATSRERIEAAKERWKTRQFEPIPGDHEDWTPLP